MVAAAAGFVRVMVDGTAGSPASRAWMARYGVRAYPTVLVLSPLGEVVELVHDRAPVVVAAQLRRLASVDYRRWRPAAPVVLPVRPETEVEAGGVRVAFGCWRDGLLRFRVVEGRVGRVRICDAAGAGVEVSLRAEGQGCVQLPDGFGEPVSLHAWPPVAPDGAVAATLAAPDAAGIVAAWRRMGESARDPAGR